MAETQTEKMYPLTYVIGALLAGLVVGTLISFAWFATDSGSPLTQTKNSGQIKSNEQTNTEEKNTSSNITNDASSATSDRATSSDVGDAASSSMLSIADQPAGLSVMVASAQVSQDQWVVIHEVKNGQPGNVLGAARFAPGATSGVVTLLRGTEAGKQYFGMIYQDNGDRAFSLADDTPLRTAEGNEVLVSFTAR